MERLDHDPILTDPREPSEIIDAVVYGRAPKQTRSLALPKAGGPDWAGRFAPPSRHGGMVKDYYAVPTIAQVKYYRALRGTGDVNTMYRGQISEAISALLGDGAKTASAEKHAAIADSQRNERRRDAAYRRQKQASWQKFYIGGKRS